MPSRVRASRCRSVTSLENCPPPVAAVRAAKASASFGSVLRDRNVASHARRTFSAESHALLLAISSFRSAFCSSVHGVFAVPSALRFFSPHFFQSVTKWPTSMPRQDSRTAKRCPSPPR